MSIGRMFVEISDRFLSRSMTWFFLFFFFSVDLHDGADGRPVVRHAFTFIKDAYLGEILHQIKEFAFCASPFPLFLNLENHCSNKQQILTAKLLIDVFGGKKPTKNSIRLFSSFLVSIFTIDEANSTSVWPSPEQLKGRIILRVSSKCSKILENFSSFRVEQRQKTIFRWITVTKTNRTKLRFVNEKVFFEFSFFQRYFSLLVDDL